MSNPKGRFGIHGGQYIPETLMNAVIELEQAYEHYKEDPGSFSRSWKLCSTNTLAGPAACTTRRS